MQKDEHSVFQAETEYDGDDYIVNSKITNPSVTEGTGVFALSYLQSITKNLAAGAEIMVQKPYPKYQEAATSLAIRYTPDDKSVWVAQAQGTNILTASYWRKISSKVDACAELQVLNMPTQGRRDAVCTVGAKYEFASATYRAQMDNTFKLSMLLEEKIAPGFSFLISGDIDYAKGENKFGVGLQLES
ncbi:putative mitochondrial import receptor subunit tom40 [Zancudomyces culisetae]|uniref:Putative mitochondrial import receptor subunit tom40 n=1 Tax=Zancudomyces culisetae TaxID=1213189 RepID=A0A1R1PZG5_ZANCU|nr:putative mitochondrial import receptor subunit tom40 [Zancudomyces culisetae]|eukprot:OMH86353.1 putative mitochondrial import receptor subunit tom40 [Zancudomyces culisetae]